MLWWSVGLREEPSRQAEKIGERTQRQLSTSVPEALVAMLY